VVKEEERRMAWFYFGRRGVRKEPTLIQIGEKNFLQLPYWKRKRKNINFRKRQKPSEGERLNLITCSRLKKKWLSRAPKGDNKKKGPMRAACATY